MKTPGSKKMLWAITIGATCALSTPAYSASADASKALYNNSCIHCHGAAGEGNRMQATFWQIRIPRLDGDYVQKKSDDELRNVILNGIRKMPPAVRGQPYRTAGLKVKPEEVPDLIAYLRSLKKK